MTFPLVWTNPAKPKALRDSPNCLYRDLTLPTSYDSYRRHNVARLVLPVTNAMKVLEIGCGTARFRENVAADCEYWGIELQPEAATETKGQVNRVLLETLSDVLHVLPDAYFDYVVCADVIVQTKIDFYQH